MEWVFFLFLIAPVPEWSDDVLWHRGKPTFLGDRQSHAQIPVLITNMTLGMFLPS
jgi:hypothetical protein